MSLVHSYIGVANAAGFLFFGIWGSIAWARNRDPGKNYWRLLALIQIALVAQVVLGGILLIWRGGQPWLHYAYGGFPVLLLVLAHRLAPRYLKGIEWAGFSFAGLISFGLLLRAWMTGSGL